MSVDENPVSRDEWDRLQERCRQLALDKSYLQLVIRMMSRIKVEEGLEPTLHNLLGAIIEVVGGTDVWLYYQLEGEIWRASALGPLESVPRIDDAAVARVFETGVAEDQESPFPDTLMLTPAFGAAHTWVHPLSVGEEVVGVFRIDNVHLALREAYEDLGTFFRFAALALRNELVNHSRLKRANDRLRALNAELESFAFSVSHDLTSPLRAISGFTQILLEHCGDGLDETARGYADQVVQATRSMQQLIAGMLTLSRASRGELEIRELDLSALVAESARNHAVLAPERQVEVVVAPDVRVQGDGRLLRAMLDNLVDNAWKYSAHAEHPRVEFGVEMREGRRVFYVRDNGVGFDMQRAGRLFTPFQRMHSADEFPGNGIGLATAQRIVRRHGGDIWAEAAPGVGATFFFTLED